METIRLLDDLGRIIIPAEVRTIMGWKEKMAIEIQCNKELGAVTLKTHTPACAYCGKAEGLKKFKGHHICPACQKDIAKL